MEYPSRRGLYYREYLEAACWWHAFINNLLTGDTEKDVRLVERLMTHYLIGAA